MFGKNKIERRWKVCQEEMELVLEV
jgi:hypothetical protein